MTIWRWALFLALALPGAGVAQRPSVSPAELAAAEAELARFTSPVLTRFGSEAEFRAYLAAARRVHFRWMAAVPRLQFAQATEAVGVQSDADEPVCDSADPACAGGDESIVVTGSQVAPRNPSITNNQMRGVEEGDIVKQIGNFLLILQDGRIFVVDTRAGEGRRLALASRIDVYRDPGHDMWYDEILVFGERVLITGYSYRDDASELSVFRLDETGRLHREGVFYLSSDDYYSSSNYATRLIGDNLVIYTPYSVAAMLLRNFRWPVVRRWVDGRSREEALRTGRPLFDAAAIYRPVRDVRDPTVHTVSVCPLGRAAAAGDLECRTTAFVGPQAESWYVTNSDAFIWTSEDRSARNRRDCEPDATFAPGDIVGALAYRIPVAGGAIQVAGTRGVPFDQFSMLASDTRFRALLNQRQQRCYEPWTAPARLAYLDLPLAAFTERVEEAGEAHYTAMPGTGSRWMINRFTDRYLVYGGLSGWRRGWPSYECDADDERCRAQRRAARAMPPAYVLPVDRPGEVRPLAIGHTVIRAEQAGNDIVLTGYRDRDGLRVTLIDLDRRPRIAASLQLDGRFESEGRSHAFNSLIERDGSGLMGLPTVARVRESDRRSWRSQASDLSFIEVTSAGRLGHAGELLRRFDYSDDEDNGVPGYTCEVSCVDWYGNSRPIFTDGRIFALTGTELIEGRMRDGEIREVQRINIALPSSRR